MIQAAVRKSPKAPDFSGLEAFTSHSFDETSGVVTSSFSKYIAEEQKAEATVMKQHRLRREEIELDKKKTDPGGGGGGRGRGAKGGGRGTDGGAAAES